MSAPRYPVLLSAVEVVAGVNDTVEYWEDETGTVRTATLPPDTYYLRGDGADDDLCRALLAALDPVGDATTVEAVELELSIDGRPATVRLKSSAPTTGTWRLLTSGSFDLRLIGFVADTEAGAGHIVTSTHTPSCVWVSNEPYTSIETEPSVEAAQHRTPAGQVYTFIASDEFHERDLVMDLVAAERARRERNPVDPAATLEAWWALARDGRPLEFHLQSIASGSSLDALSSSTLIGRYVLGLESIRRPPVTLREIAQALYTARLKLLGYVP